MTTIHYLTATELNRHPKLQDSMFRDRATQFVKRHKWPHLTVDHLGWERDEYDFGDPLYVILELPDGSHGASMRLAPMVGPNMINDHFSCIDLPDYYQKPDIWECSRFLVSSKTSNNAIAALLVAAGELFNSNRVELFLGVFDRRMLRLYRSLRIEPFTICSYGKGQNWLGIGSWKMSHDVWRRSLALLGIDRKQSRLWIEQSQCHTKKMTRTRFAVGQINSKHRMFLEEPEMNSDRIPSSKQKMLKRGGPLSNEGTAHASFVLGETDEYEN